MLLLFLQLLGSGCKEKKTEVVMSGGPKGGTFQTLASGLAELVNKNLAEVDITVEPSGGSVANLSNVDKNRHSMGLAFSGDAFLMKEGKLEKGGARKTANNVTALASLYGAKSHLVVHRDSRIRSPYDLSGLRVAIGSHGSGSTLSAKRYFQALGIWDKIIPIYVGYDIGISELKQRGVDAVWLQVSYPNDSILELSKAMPIQIVNLHNDAAAKGFYSTYPFYSEARIPAATYYGQEDDILTFEDAALLVANKEMDQEIVYRLLRLLYSEQGIAWMHSIDPLGRNPDQRKGLKGIKIPLHPGAERFWKEMEKQGPFRKPAR
ncbi:MAG: TAXI family TRAP transporter solute-binding subunit [Deltaproteobacteria bacterium]|nr:TAXI family TRAP transporter solute-binding subunit [Deltaproteobacteria bacterium]